MNNFKKIAFTYSFKKIQYLFKYMSDARVIVKCTTDIADVRQCVNICIITS